MQNNRKPLPYFPLEKFSCSWSTTNLQRFISEACSISIYLIAQMKQKTADLLALDDAIKQQMNKRKNKLNISLYQHGIDVVADMVIKSRCQ